MRFRSHGPRGPQTVATRAAYLWVDRNTPQDTILLFNPDIYIEYFNSLYGYRQTVSAGLAYGPFFSVGPAGEETLQDAIRFFARDQSLSQINAVCRHYHVGAIVVLSTDPVWVDRSSWIWKVQPSYANERARVYVVSELQKADLENADQRSRLE
jgi:hypothetical protein